MNVTGCISLPFLNGQVKLNASDFLEEEGAKQAQSSLYACCEVSHWLGFVLELTCCSNPPSSP